MKKLTGLVLILAVLILGGYYGMGFLTESRIKKNIEVINQTNGLMADVQEYHRGWFASTAKIKWRLHIPERIVTDSNGAAQTVPAQDYQKEMALVIHHGPFIFSNHKVRFGAGYAETVFSFPEEYNKQFDEQFTKESTKPQIDLNIFVNYFLKSSLNLIVPEFKLIAQNGGDTFTWKGLESVFNMSADKEQIDGDVIIDGLTFSKDGVTASLDKVTTEYDLHQTNSGLYLGDASFSLPSFAVVDKKEVIVSIKELLMNSSSDINDGLFSTHFSLGLKSVMANKKTYGPGELELVLRNLDADVLAKINQQVTAMQNGTDAERQQAMLSIFPQLPKLFGKGAEFEISKCNFKIPEGSIDGNLIVTLPKGENANPFELMQKVQGHAKFKAPSALVKQLLHQSVAQQMEKQPEMQQALIQQLQAADPKQAKLTDEQIAVMQADKQLATMVQNGLVVLSGSDCVIEVTLEQGKFTVNGKPFDPAMLKF